MHGNGSEWTVNPDWEAATGLVHDLFQISLNESSTALCEHFKGEPVFLEVIDAILELDRNRSLCDRKRAQHWASQFMIKDGKLWCIGGGPATRGGA
jgi:hypothetical protein